MYTFSKLEITNQYLKDLIYSFQNILNLEIFVKNYGNVSMLYFIYDNKEVSVRFESPTDFHSNSNINNFIKTRRFCNIANNNVKYRVKHKPSYSRYNQHYKKFKNSHDDYVKKEYRIYSKYTLNKSLIRTLLIVENDDGSIYTHKDYNDHLSHEDADNEHFKSVHSIIENSFEIKIHKKTNVEESVFVDSYDFIPPDDRTVKEKFVRKQTRKMRPYYKEFISEKEGVVRKNKTKDFVQPSYYLYEVSKSNTIVKKENGEVLVSAFIRLSLGKFSKTTIVTISSKTYPKIKNLTNDDRELYNKLLIDSYVNGYSIHHNTIPNSKMLRMAYDANEMGNGKLPVGEPVKRKKILNSKRNSRFYSKLQLEKEKLDFKNSRDFYEFLNNY